MLTEINLNGHRKKPGRKATGLVHPILFPLMVTEEMREYVLRKAYDKMGRQSAGDYLRTLVFKRGWELDLKELRIKQRAVSETEWQPRVKSRTA